MDSPLKAHFPEIEPARLEALSELERIFREWNSRINLVSRKDMDAFILHHLVHALAVTKFVPFNGPRRVLDVGTGGGLPGLPLAILNPGARFFLCDSIAKKANAVRAMAGELGLTNVEVVHKRAETLESRWDFILGRAVTSLPKFLGWIQKNIRKGGDPECPNGVLYWKGSLYAEELAAIGCPEPFKVYDIHSVIPDPYFQEKYIVHLSHKQVAGLSLESD